MEDHKLIALHEQLSKLAPKGKTGGLGFHSSVKGQKKGADGKQKSALYSYFVKAGEGGYKTFKSDDESTDKEDEVSVSADASDTKCVSKNKKLSKEQKKKRKQERKAEKKRRAKAAKKDKESKSASSSEDDEIAIKEKPKRSAKVDFAFSSIEQRLKETLAKLANGKSHGVDEDSEAAVVRQSDRKNPKDVKSDSDSDSDNEDEVKTKRGKSKEVERGSKKRKVSESRSVVVETITKTDKTEKKSEKEKKEKKKAKKAKKEKKQKKAENADEDGGQTSGVDTVAQTKRSDDAFSTPLPKKAAKSASAESKSDKTDKKAAKKEKKSVKKEKKSERKEKKSEKKKKEKN